MILEMNFLVYSVINNYQKFKMNNTIFFSLYNLAHQSVFLDWVIVFCANILGNILILISCIFLLFYTNGFMSFKNFSLKLNLEDRFKNLILVFFFCIYRLGFYNFFKVNNSFPSTLYGV